MLLRDTLIKGGLLTVYQSCSRQRSGISLIIHHECHFPLAIFYAFFAAQDHFNSNYRRFLHYFRKTVNNLNSYVLGCLKLTIYIHIIYIAPLKCQREREREREREKERERERERANKRRGTKTPT